MWKPVDKRQKTLLVFAVVCLAVAGLFFYFQWLDPGSHLNQRINLRRANGHIAVVENLIMDDLRFRDVRVGAYTGQPYPQSKSYGCLSLSGYVYSAMDLEELHRIVSSTNPPTEVRFDIKVFPPE